MNKNIANNAAPKPGEDDPWINPDLILHRINPAYSNGCYLIWVDLNEFIRRNASTEAIKVLDYGAGASPYRHYFPNADYRRADITGMRNLDYLIRPDSTIAEADETFDLILSTQVAEHVVNPEVYLKECFRLLKKGGRLVLTTHGIWEEHGSPYDYQRWTEGGIRRDVMAAGFKELDIYKLTCGIRAGILLFTRILFTAQCPEQRVPRFFFKAFRFSYSRLFGLLHRICEKWFSGEGIIHTKDAEVNPVFYVDIAVIAKK